MEGASKIGTSFEIILPLNIAIKVYVITGIENSVDQMDHATLVRFYQIFPIQQFKVIVSFSFSTINVKIPGFQLISIFRSSWL